MSTRAFLVGLVMLALGIAPAQATTTTWNGGNGGWGTAEKWDSGIPSEGSIVNIGSGNVEYDVSTDPSIRELHVTGKGTTVNHSANTLTIAPTADDDSYLFLNDGGQYILGGSGSLIKGPGEIKIGGQGYGSFTQTGGTFEFEGMMYVGDQNDALGQYFMSGGTLTGVGSGDKDIVLGEHAGSQGSFEHSGGIVDIGSLTLGRNGGDGTYIMSGKSVTELFGEGTSLPFVDADGNDVPDIATEFLGVNSDLVVGGKGTGSFSQNGGVVFVKDFLTLGNDVDSSGEYSLSEGLLWTGNTLVGAHGQSDFYQAGGLHLIGIDPFNNMVLLTKEDHYLQVNSGTYELESGRLLVASELIGTGGQNSRFLQTGGEHRVYKDLTVGASSEGTYDMRGGTLEVGREEDTLEQELLVGGGDAKGVFTQGEEESSDSPSVTVHGNLVVDNKLGVTDYSTYILTSGLLQTENTFIGRMGSGSFNQNGGIHRVGVDEDGILMDGYHWLVLGKEVGADGSYFMSGGVLDVGLEVVGSDGGRGSFFQTGGTHKVLESLFVGYGSEAGTGAIGSFALDGDAQVTTGKTFIGYDGGSGSLRLGGSAKLIQNDQIFVGATSTGYQPLPSNGVVYQGYDASRQVEQSSSSVQVGQLILGRDARATGTYNLNSGTLQTRHETIGDEGVATFTQTGGSNTANTMTIGSRGEYAFKGGTLDVDTLENHGLFQGTGDITVNSFTNHGTLAPGNSPGTLNIDGDYSQGSGGILEIEIGSSLFDVLNITGTANLAGTLQISLWEDFKPMVGSTFNFLVASGGITGDGFSSILGPSGWKWDVAYLDLDELEGFDTAQLRASAVPLPGAAILFGSGLLGLVGLRRRQIR